LLFPDDWTTDDWQRDREEEFTGPGETNFFYEGYGQYGFFGESIFQMKSANEID